MGRTFLAGSEVPLDITLLPLTPLKVYLVSAIFEGTLSCPRLLTPSFDSRGLLEKVTFSAEYSPHVDHDPQRIYHVVNLKGSVANQRPLLPLVNDTVGAVTSSPLYEAVALNEREGDLPAIEQHLTRAHGPWQLTIKMKVPGKLKDSHDYPESNVKVSHTIRVTLQVGAGDKGKTYNITMQFPCRIVSVSRSLYNSALY